MHPRCLPAILLSGLLAVLPACRPGATTGPQGDGTGGAAASSIAAAAQQIRDGAGIPEGEVIGVRPGPPPGATKRAQLQPSEAIRITSRADAIAVARGGSGTAVDPYRIEHRSILADITAKSGDYGFDWEDPAADYHIQLHNVEIAGFDVCQMRVNTGTGLEISNATVFGDGDGGGGLRVGEGKVAVWRTEFTALGGDGVRTIGNQVVRIDLIDCAWTESRGPWANGVVAIQSRSSNPLAGIVVRYCEFSAASLDAGARAWNDGEWSISNSHFAGINGFQATNEPIQGVSIQRNRFDVSGAPIFANGLQGGFDIGYNEFNESADGERLVRLNDCENGRVHHNRFTKSVGVLPGNECLEGFDCADIVFEYNWVTACTEDAYEHVRPRGGCVVRHSVGDNVAGQIVDYFENHPENGGEIHHIYGDCGDIGVIITDVDNLFVHDIHTNNVAGTFYNVRLENRHAEAGVHPANCTFAPPLPLAVDSYQGFIFGGVGPVGPGNFAQWWKGGVLQTWSS